MYLSYRSYCTTVQCTAVLYSTVQHCCTVLYSTAVYVRSTAVYSGTVQALLLVYAYTCIHKQCCTALLVYACISIYEQQCLYSAAIHGCAAYIYSSTVQYCTAVLYSTVQYCCTLYGSTVATVA